ncbi:FAD/NAD(P)-binding domain-containing protein, partial [Aureobasidium melanogenum]
MEKVDTSQVIDLDALIVGAGFGGVYQLKRLRDLGYNVRLVESGTDFGGVWYWNRYPGARVDIPIPHYEFSDPQLWEEWTWKQRFPGSAELRAYFSFVADTWDIRDHCVFNSYVNSAIWDEESSKWIVKIRGGLTYRATFFLPNTGFAAKRYIPDWKGIDSFKGTWIHPSFWPAENLDLKGKRIAVIGTGSTGVQLSQELAPVASEFVLFQRTPNLALPMKQQEFDGEAQTLPKEQYPDLYTGRKFSFCGIDYSFSAQKTFDHTPEERRVVYEALWAHGDFHFWLATYGDMLFSDEANTEAYNFCVDASEEASNNWAEGIAVIANMSLLPTARSWYMGDNIPGKRRECLIYLGGVPNYYKLLNECAANNYDGFVFS